MKKKVMAVLTAAGMAGMLLSPFTAMAADQNVSVSYTKANEYELSIPKTVTLSASEEIVMKIGATKMNIEPGKEVRVSVKKGIKIIRMKHFFIKMKQYTFFKKVFIKF